MAELDALVQRVPAALASEDGKLLARLHEVFGDDSGRWLMFRVEDTVRKRQTTAVEVRPTGAPEARRQRIAEIDAVLKERSWVTLAPYAIEDDPTLEPRFTGLGVTTPRRARGEGWLVMFHEPLLIVQEEAGRAVLRRAFPRWTPNITLFGQRCNLATDLVAVAGNRAKRLLLVSVRSHGSPHFCEAVGGEHLVVLPRG
jgi:hypothetical protein